MVCHDASAVYGAVITGRRGVLKILQEIISVAALCGKARNCPKLKLLTLHRINSMPESVK